MTTHADAADTLMLRAGAVAVGALTVGTVMAGLLRIAGRVEERRYAVRAREGGCEALSGDLRVRISQQAYSGLWAVG